MSEEALGVVEVLVIVAAVGVAVAVPELVKALARRLGGPVEVRACLDCGDHLTDGDGTTCLTCRNVRRRRLSREQGATGEPKRGGDNSS